MGVKGLWSYVEHHNIQYAYPNKSARAACYGVNPRHLFIDMNAVMHIAYDAATPTTAATLRHIAARVDELLSKVRPLDTLVLVFDGVAPTAKLRTQKERRRSLAVNAPRPASTVQAASPKASRTTQPSSSSSSGGGPHVAAASGAISSSLYTSDLSRDGVPLAREEILCGAEFVLACEEYMTSHLERRKTAHHSWRRLRVCGCRVAGEGEVKIAGVLRQLWAADVADGTYSPDDAVSFAGNDSDLILVAMLATPYTLLTLIDPFDFSLTSLHELMGHWSQAVPNPPLSPELLPSYRTDFVFLMLLAGDDYYEGIRGDAVGLWRRYRHLRANEGFFRRSLLSGPAMELDVEFLRTLFARTGSMTAQMSRVPRNKRKTAKAVLRHGAGGASGGSVKDGTQLLAAALWSMKSYVVGRCVDYRFHAQLEGVPSVGSLRAASQAKGLSHKIGADCPEGSAAPVEGEKGEAAAGPLFTPLEQCLAVLGIRGRYSVELSRAVHTCTPDGGHSLTTSTSLSYLSETVKSIMAAVDVARLTAAERMLSAPSALRVDDGDGASADEWAFMRLAVIPPRNAVSSEAAAAAVGVEAAADSGSAVQEGDGSSDAGDDDSDEGE